MIDSPVVMFRFHRRLALWMLAGLCWSSAPVMAGAEFACVRCSGPEQTYRCRTIGEEAVPPPALRFFCMTQIAREHVHESCAVVRAAGSCEGVEVSYVYQDQNGDAQPARAEAEPQKPASEPSTVAEMTRGSGEAWKKAGQAVGEATVNAGKAVGNATMKAGQAVSDATKRTLECLGSALNGC